MLNRLKFIPENADTEEPMVTAKHKILCVEDDAAVRQALKEILLEDGFLVDQAATLREAREKLTQSRYSAVLLDLNLPDGRSFDLCRELRADSPTLPIVIVTAHTDEGNAVRGLSNGATDYVRKPFGRMELLQRVRNLIRSQSAEIVQGDLRVEPDGRRAWVGKKEVTLTPSEFAILVALIRHHGEAVSVDQLLDALGDEGERDAVVIRTHVSRLRNKLKNNGEKQQRIVPVYGWGYRLEKKAA